MRDDILIVEDSDDDFEVTEFALRQSDCMKNIVRCKNGDDALKYINQKTYSRLALILLDLNMPGLDGRHVLACLKQHPEYKAIPLVVLTTSSDKKDIIECYSKGANTYIQKSMDFEEFQYAISLVKDYWFSVATIH